MSFLCSDLAETEGRALDLALREVPVARLAAQPHRPDQDRRHDRNDHGHGADGVPPEPSQDFRGDVHVTCQPVRIVVKSAVKFPLICDALPASQEKDRGVLGFAMRPKKRKATTTA